MMTILLLLTSSFAWEHAGHAWTTAEDPLDYVTDDDGTGDCLDGIPGGVCADTVAWAFDQWAAEACLPAVPTDVGVEPALGAAGLGDGVSSIAFTDVDEELEPGVTFQTRYTTTGIAFELDGRTYQHATEFDVVFAEGTAWATQDAIELGQCEGAYNLDAHALLLAGRVLGLGASFDAETPAVMSPFASGYGQCERLTPIGPDDVDGLWALYGPQTDLLCGTDGQEVQIGVVSMSRNCVVSADSPILEARWSFGDGTTATGTEVSHTWEREGLYTVRVELDVDDDTCGETTAVAERIGYIRACDEPRARFSATHVFGRTYDFHNETPIDVIGCITDVQWGIYKGDEAKGEPFETLDTWEFRYDFPKDGTWTVVLNTGGPAGTRASSVTMDVVAHAGLHPFGCDHGGAPVGGLALGLLGLLGLRRRR